MMKQPYAGCCGIRWVALGGGVTLGLALALSGSSLRGQQGKSVSSGGAAQGAQASAGDAFTKEERERISQRVIAQPEVKASHAGHRLQVLRVTKGPVDDKPLAGKPPRRLADVILYDHSSGHAEHVVFDATNNQMVKREPMRGAPAPTEDELDEAARIARSDPQNARLLEAGGQLTGGFLASAPSGFPPNDRFVQLQLLTPNRREIQRMIIVDLTTGSIASAK